MKLALIILLFSSCVHQGYYRPSTCELEKRGFKVHCPDMDKTDLCESWWFYTTDSSIYLISYYPGLNAWKIGCGEDGYVLSTIDVEVNTRREFNLLLQDLKPDKYKPKDK
jgi:hypothetical protein